jgi:hypothetical protein
VDAIDDIAACLTSLCRSAGLGLVIASFIKLIGDPFLADPRATAIQSCSHSYG